MDAAVPSTRTGMWLAQLPFPEIDPTAFSVGPFAVKWYGIAYAVGFVLAYLIFRRLHAEDRLDLNPREAEDLIFYCILGVVLGGRLGYVLFYKSAEYLEDPVRILQVWKGGMSFHGGLLGVIVAALVFCRRKRKSPLSVLDATAIGVTPGIFLVRIANFVNGELWGRPTDVPWAFVFPLAGDRPRHPSQLYEALLEGLLLFCILWLFRKRQFFARPGGFGIVFAFGYAAGRFGVEFFREPDRHLGTVLGPFSMGQLLSLGLILIGIALIVARRRHAPPEPDA